VAQRSHYSSAVYYDDVNKVLGLMLILANGLVLGAVGVVDWPVGTSMKLLISVLAALASLLAAVQTFLNPDERAARHRRFAIDFSILQRAIEEHLARRQSVETTDEFVASFNKRYSELLRDAPTPRGRDYRREERAARVVDGPSNT
jgi:hypothetical protein